MSPVDDAIREFIESRKALFEFFKNENEKLYAYLIAIGNVDGGEPKMNFDEMLKQIENIELPSDLTNRLGLAELALYSALKERYGSERRGHYQRLFDHNTALIDFIGLPS